MSPSSQIPDADITAAFRYADTRRIGCLYAVHFTGAGGDVVKVGRSISIYNRLRSHRKQAKAMGAEFVAQWVSEPHLDTVTTEEILLAFCREQWRGINGGDWFETADHDSIVKYGTDIPKKTLTEDMRKARAAYFLSAKHPVEAAAAAVGLTYQEAAR